MRSRTKLGYSLLSGALAMALGLCGCTPRVVETKTAVEFGNPLPDPELPTAAVLAPPDQALVGVVRQLRNELQDEFNVVVTPIESGKHTTADVGAVVTEKVKAVFLLNNSSARLYRDWSRTQESPPVSIILMASFADQLQRSIKNSVGIAYEVPAVTSFVGLRALGTSVNRVGVVYREKFRHYVEAQGELAAVEKIPFVTQELSNSPHVRELKAAIVRLYREDVDVIWLPNDNGLLSREMVAKGWLPYLERLGIPVVVGVPSLVRADTNFGTFGAIPDPEALAIQAADLLFQIMDGDWSVNGLGVALPLSVKTYVAPQLGSRYGMKRAMLQKVDVVVGRSTAPQERATGPEK